MAQDLGNDSAAPDGFSLDASSELDLVTIFASSNFDAELEAGNIHGVLQAAGVPSVIVGASVIPSLSFEVQVPRARLEEAERLLREAQANGPSAAAEAEAASEGL